MKAKRLLLSAGPLFGAFKHLNDEDKRQLTVELISNEALKTSAIEGEYLDRCNLQSSIQRQFGLITDNRKISAAEQGIAEVMVDLYRSFNVPLSHNLLFERRSMLTKGRRDLKDVDRYRTHNDPMQIVSGAIHAPKVHFEADAQSYTATWIEFLINKAKFYDRLRGQLNPWQEKVLARLFREGPDGFIGSLSAEKYIGITGAPRSTATRDLQDMVGKVALLRRGERNTRYHLNLELT